MHVSNTSTLSLEKTALLDKLHELEESNLEKVDKLVKLEENKRKAKKSKSRGRNANKTSHSDENQAFAKEKNDLLRQIDFLNSIILDTKLKEPNKSKAHFVKNANNTYIKDEPVTIRRTQFGTQLKLRPKFCEPYLIKTVKPHDRNEVKNVGQHEGPHLTSTAVDLMKRFAHNILDFLFRCGQLIFRMADCEVEGTIASPLASPREDNVPDGGKERRSKNIRTRQNPLGPQERADAHQQSSNNS
ncbi:hypothetical protein TNCV_4096071 [Trichonephila clavipes]|nr:hypothetical protein TNCV_4096071 [Trichonephila clavipes]